MMTTETDIPIVDATPVEENPVQAALVPTGSQALAVTPTVKAGDLVERLDVIKQAAEQAMTENVDYGKVSGTNKPTLLKPGAEKLSVLFQLDVQLENEKRWGPGDHLTVISRATVFHAPTGSRLGFGEGVCSTRERKYAYRRGERVCPQCGKPAIIKGKQEYGGGWVCFKRKDGCGTKFQDGDPSIESQQAGEIENPDLPDLWNTVVKMAEKRARVDAVLAVTGASALFTQDVEDAPSASAAESAAPAAAHERAGLDEGSVREVIAAISAAQMGTDWVRRQLVAVGAANVPDGLVMHSTIAALSPAQAAELVELCARARDRREEVGL